MASTRERQLSLPVVDETQLRTLSEKVILSGCLGRSPVYKNLFKYLIEKSIAGYFPKEIEIAIEVLGRNSDFDVTRDSVVRVYVHKLRKKLQDYYSGPGIEDPYQLSVAKGQYTITTIPRSMAIAQNPEKTSEAKTSAPLIPWLLALCVGLLVINIFYIRSDSQQPVPVQSDSDIVKQHPLWSAIANDDSPVIIVLGDYFIFGETDQDGHIRRMVREFDINSARDLRLATQDSEELAQRSLNLNLTYLPSASALALKDVLSILDSDGRNLNIRMMSELDTNDLKSNHIIYIGYISAMDKLLELVFASSNLTIGSSYDELINIQTGEMFTSSAGLTDETENFIDYGLVSSFPTPSGHQIVVLAGTRDAGLAHIAQSLTHTMTLDGLTDKIPENNSGNALAFEALYEVFGFNRVNFDSMLVYSGPLDYRTIWGGDQLNISKD
jgi:hypothetical protein